MRRRSVQCTDVDVNRVKEMAAFAPKIVGIVTKYFPLGTPALLPNVRKAASATFESEKRTARCGKAD